MKWVEPLRAEAEQCVLDCRDDFRAVKVMSNANALKFRRFLETEGAQRDHFNSAISTGNFDCPFASQYTDLFATDVRSRQTAYLTGSSLLLQRLSLPCSVANGLGKAVVHRSCRRQKGSQVQEFMKSLECITSCSCGFDYTYRVENQQCDRVDVVRSCTTRREVFLRI